MRLKIALLDIRQVTVPFRDLEQSVSHFNIKYITLESHMMFVVGQIFAPNHSLEKLTLAVKSQSQSANL